MHSMNVSPPQQFELDQVRFIKKVVVGSIDPQQILSSEEQEQQLALLNQCLSEYPKGRIIGRDVSIASYQLGEHKVTLQRTSYHIGFIRKPYWITAEEQAKK